MDGNNSILAESINSFKKFITQDAIALEIHFNSGPNNATGVETLTPANPSNNEITIASNLSQIIRDLMIIPLRGKNGVKSELESHHGKLGWMRQNCETVLLEVCFISNPEEMNRYQSTKFDIAKKIAAYLYNVCSGNIIKEAQKSIIHQVVAGETLTSISKIYNVKIDEIKLANNLQGDYLQIGQKLRIIT
jgi:LysM repeat protein